MALISIKAGTAESPLSAGCLRTEARQALTAAPRSSTAAPHTPPPSRNVVVNTDLRLAVSRAPRQSAPKHLAPFSGESRPAGGPSLGAFSGAATPSRSQGRAQLIRALSTAYRLPVPRPASRSKLGRGPGWRLGRGSRRLVTGAEPLGGPPAGTSVPIIRARIPVAGRRTKPFPVSLCLSLSLSISVSLSLSLSLSRTLSLSLSPYP